MALAAALAPCVAMAGSAGRLAAHANRLDAPAGWRERSVMTAAAWGRCIVARAPGDSRAFVVGRDNGRLHAIEARLDPVADRCLPETGRFAGDGDRYLRRLAVAEALRSRGGA